MLKDILNTHRNMMYEFMEVTGLDAVSYTHLTLPTTTPV